MSNAQPEYCIHCGTVQPMTVRHFISCTFIECAVCHRNVDTIWNDDENDDEDEPEAQP